MTVLHHLVAHISTVLALSVSPTLAAPPAPPQQPEPAPMLVVGARELPPEITAITSAYRAEHDRLVATLPEEVRHRPLLPCNVQTPPALRSGSTTRTNKRWLEKTVPYDFDSSVGESERSLAINAMNLIASVSQVTFVARSGQAAYIRFYDSDGNNAGVGAPSPFCDFYDSDNDPQTAELDVGERWFQSGENHVNIFNWSSQGTLIHEIFHTLGFWHTQSRRDRDQYVRINWSNIDDPQAHEHNFYLETDSSLILPYDFDSLMHYGGCAFSDCPFCPACAFDPDGDDGKTIITLDSDNQSRIGQRDSMSSGDIFGLWVSYGNWPGSIANDIPELCEFLAPSQSLARSLFGAAATFAPIYVGTGTPPSPDEYYPSAAWFRVVGNGGTFRADLTDPGVNVRGLAVHRLAPQHNCGTPLNLAAIDQRVAIGSTSAVWRTVADEVYMVAVRGWVILPQTETSSFTIDLTDLGTVGNDSCSNAEPLSVTIPGLTPVLPPVLGDLTAASNDGGTNCAAQIDITNPRNDVWYQYEAPYTGQLNLLIDTTSSGPNTIMSVHSGCPGTASNQIACNTSRGPFQEDPEITLNVFAHQVLFVRVSWEFTFGTANDGLRDGLFALSSTLAVGQPPNSNCTSAITITPGTPQPRSMFGAPMSGAATCAGFPHAVYYQFTAPAAATLRLSAAPLNGSLPPYLSIHSAPCPATTINQLACGYGLVSAALTAGQSVIIRAAGTWDTQFTLNSSFSPANDLCTDAIQIVDGSTEQGSLTTALNDGQTNCGNSDGADVWYRFTPPSDGTLIIDTVGTFESGGPDTVLSVYSGCPGTTANLLACNDDAPGGETFDSVIGLSMSAGQPVLIRVGHYGGASNIYNGTFFLHTDFVPTTQIIRLDPNPTIEQSVRFKADLRASVSGVDAADFAMTETGTLSGTSITRMAPSAGMRFDGTAASEIVAGMNPIYNVTAGLTVEAWVRVDGTQAALNQILSTNSPRNAGIRWGILGDGRVDFTRLGVQNYFSSQARVADNVWTHVAVVFDTGGEANYYINGVFIETVSGNAGIISNPGASVLLGGDPGGNQFAGQLDAVRFWNVQRTPAEIAAGMYAELNGDESGLIGYWKLDTFEDLGIAAAGVNDVRDSSPIAAHGNAGDVVLCDGRPAGPALRFSRAAGGRVVVPNNAAYSLPNTFTVEARVKANDLPNGSIRHAFFGADNAVPPTGGIQVGRDTNGNLIFTAFGVADLPVGIQPFTPGQWVHIAVSVDGSRVVRYYVNGVQFTSMNLSQDVRPWVSPLYIGRSAGNGLWDGEIDEVRYWSVVRSAAEISANVNRQLTGTEPGLIGHWTLNALEDLGVGNTGRNDVVDSSPLGNHGDAINVAEGPVASYFITADTGTGAGQLGLDLLDNGTILDAGGTPLQMLTSTSETYTIDHPNLCTADFDGSGTVAVPDIFAFLSAWFAQGPGSDFDGNGAVAVPDIFAFLSAWFSGCP